MSEASAIAGTGEAIRDEIANLTEAIDMLACQLKKDTPSVRELAAVAALGQLADTVATDWPPERKQAHWDRIADQAVRQADALIERLHEDVP